MPIRARCQDCDRTLNAPEKYAGKRVKCPDCGGVIRVPGPRAAAVDDDGKSAGPKLPPRVIGAPPKRKKKPAAGSAATTGAAGTSAVAGHHAYWALLVALVPLVYITFTTDDTEARYVATAEEHPDALVQAIDEVTLEIDGEAFLAALPEQRIQGASFSQDTKMHVLFAALSGIFYLALLVPFARGSAGPATLLVIALFTGIVGISLLLGFQWLAMATHGWAIVGRSIVVLLFWLVKLIGLSYYCAIRPEYTFWPSFFGFTFGVGLCEELCKAIPIVWYLRTDDDATWRSAAVVGLASGVGFGISEGIVYSDEMYNGVATGAVYAVRFVSCVALHAIWACTVALFMYRNQDFVHGELEFDGIAMFVVVYLGVPMVLHGLYNALLKAEMNVGALAVAGVSFALMAWAIESSQSEFGTAGATV